MPFKLPACVPSAIDAEPSSSPARARATRRMLLSAVAGASLAGCALVPPAPPAIQVNLTRATLPPPPPDAPGEAEADTAVRAGFDAVRRMSIQVMVNGEGPFVFVVDTGANRSVLSSETARILGLEPSGRTMVYGIAGVFPSGAVDVETLTLSSLTTRGLRMPVLPRAYLGADGLLGVDVLSNRRARLDFARQRFSVAASSGALLTRDRTTGSGGLSRGSIVVPARQRFGQLTVVDAEMGGVSLTAFLDSGAEISVGNLALRDAVLRRPGLLSGGLTRLELISATGQSIVGDLATAPRLRLGGLRLDNLSCVFADLQTFAIWRLQRTPALLIGVDVMRHFDSVELDFGRSNVTFRSRSAGR